ncbi:MAG: ATP-binding cassette domain-containing protein [Acidimicrobiia bacterium]
MPSAIVTRALSKSFGDIVALDGLDLDVPAGTVFGLLGPDGAGKTTTVRLLLGLLRPGYGTVEILGHDLRHPGDPVLADVGAIVDGPAFVAHASGRTNLDMWRRARRTKGIGSRRVEQVLAGVGLDAAEDAKVRTYSRGMLARLALARALLCDPDLLVLDEPTEGLDARGVHEVRDLLRALSAGGRTIFFTSRDLDEVELVCDHAAVISGGRLVASGPMEVLRGREVLELDTPDPVRACEVVAALGGRAAPNARGVAIEGIADPAVLVRWLVHYGIAVRALTPTRVGLDATVLDVTESDPDAGVAESFDTQRLSPVDGSPTNGRRRRKRPRDTRPDVPG